jgi:cytochrome c-type biogenesis protein CcmH
VEIARRLLAADSKARAADRVTAEGTRARTAMICVGAALPLLALGLYLAFGSPRLPDQPLEARLEDPASDRNLEALVARVEARLRQHPEEGEGWEVIAPVYLSWQRYGDAAEAYGHAIRLLGPSAKRLSGEGQALVLANNGVVTEEARQALEQANKLDPTLIEPRILLAIAKEQDGQFAAAVADWQSLLSTADAGAPWRAMVEQRIALAEAHLAGKSAPDQPVPDGAAPAAQGAPSDADIAAAQNPAAGQTMNPADEQAMIELMVQRLADRLDRDGSDLTGWLKLVRAYSVLDRKDDALKALQRAKSEFSGDAKAIEQLDRLAAELGLKS